MTTEPRRSYRISDWSVLSCVTFEFITSFASWMSASYRADQRQIAYNLYWIALWPFRRQLPNLMMGQEARSIAVGGNPEITDGCLAAVSRDQPQRSGPTSLRYGRQTHQHVGPHLGDEDRTVRRTRKAVPDSAECPATPDQFA